MKNGYYDNNVFAGNLKAMVERKGVTYTDVAKGIGVSQPTVSDWCNGKKIPRMDKVEKLCEFFGCETTDLIGPATMEATPVSDNPEGLSELSWIWQGLGKSNQLRLLAYALELQEQERIEIVRKRVRKTQETLSSAKKNASSDGQNNLS